MAIGDAQADALGGDLETAAGSIVEAERAQRFRDVRQRQAIQVGAEVVVVAPEIVGFSQDREARLGGGCAVGGRRKLRRGSRRGADGNPVHPIAERIEGPGARVAQDHAVQGTYLASGLVIEPNLGAQFGLAAGPVEGRVSKEGGRRLAGQP